MDGISGSLLKSVAPIISMPLAKIINRSLDEVFSPSLWKAAKVKPTFKSRMEMYRCSNVLLNWFYLYLYNRSLNVVLNHAQSKCQEVQHGVPQGSIMGPLLFNIYLKDLTLHLNKFTVHMYADDRKVLVCYCALIKDDNIYLNSV